MDRRISKGRKGKPGRKGQHSVAFKLQVCRSYLDGDESYAQVGLHYGVRREQICRWIQAYYPELSVNKPTATTMTEAEQKELEALRKQNKDLKAKLEYADMKATALEIMIDIAEKQLGVDIKKKPGTKQP